MTHLYLIRHGDFMFGLKDGRYLDLGLTPLGVTQAERLRDRLARTGEIQADVLIASTLPRARQTAEILAPALGLPVVLDEEVEEWRNEDGSLSPGELEERAQAIPEGQMPFFRWVPGCENWLEFSIRADAALNRIVREHAGKTIVVVCHGNVIEAAFSFFLGASGAPLLRFNVLAGHTSISHWQKEVPFPGFLSEWLLERFNDRVHLVEPVGGD
ncbi:MAG TPA: histidine phosphatase family protein [Ktedonobacterales bacterium]